MQLVTHQEWARNIVVPNATRFKVFSGDPKNGGSGDENGQVELARTRACIAGEYQGYLT